MAPTIDLTLDWRAQRVIKKDGVWTVDGRPTNSGEVAWNRSLPNAPGKAYIGLKVTSPVSAATPPHRHGGAAVSATVIRGRVLNQMICADGRVDGPKVYEEGESWYEPPGCRHVRCENAGDGEAVYIAGFVVEERVVKEKGVIQGLVQFDADTVEEGEEEEKK